MYIACGKKCAVEQKNENRHHSKEGNHLNTGGRANILGYLIKSSSLALFI